MIQSKTLAKLLTAAGSALLALALLAPMAQAAKTAPGYEQFSGCPTAAESPGTPICIRSDVTGGHLTMGKKTVPIENPLTLSGGVNEAFEGFTAGPEGGLSKTPQKIPGGVIGLTGLTWLLEFFGSEALTLYGTTELAGIPSNFTFETVTLPIKVHLTNPSGLLGSSCYVGSNTNPIVLHLTTGTTKPPEGTKPLTGKSPEFGEEGEIVFARNGTYVDNTFPVPGASGCQMKLFGFININLNPLVNEQAGLPSPAGKNESVQDFDLEFTLRSNVYP
ncbi:MAG TPA: hypothetical protein VHQ43_08880 [Solirubrobacterales bacterium]|jgi:hypothetical protein|nr:hypothetical protein [Solirubrobacterales bacterium]